MFVQTGPVSCLLASLSKLGGNDQPTLKFLHINAMIIGQDIQDLKGLGIHALAFDRIQKDEQIFSTNESSRMNVNALKECRGTAPAGQVGFPTQALQEFVLQVRLGNVRRRRRRRRLGGKGHGRRGGRQDTGGRRRRHACQGTTASYESLQEGAKAHHRRRRQQVGIFFSIMAGHTTRLVGLLVRLMRMTR